MRLYSYEKCTGCGYDLSGTDGSSGRCPECGRNFVKVQPIARYRERQLQFSREFLLCPDRVFVRTHRYFKSKSEAVIQLVSLDPEFQHLTIRDGLFNHGLSILLIGGIFAGLAWFANILASPWLLWGSTAATLAGFIVVLLTIRPIEYTQFRSAASITTVALDVARRGPDVGTYNDFIATLRRQIELAKKAAGSGQMNSGT